MLFLLVLGMLGLSGHPAYAGLHERVSLGSAADWVQPLSGDVQPAKSEGAESEAFLLLDKQINAQTGETYLHVVRHLLDATGVQNGSGVLITFDPAYASVKLHRLQIRRGNETLDRLSADRIQVLQRESDLEKHLYRGELSIVVLLEDVRAGDRIEYSYTTHGRNPVFQGKVCGSLPLQTLMPIQQLRYRLLFPSARSLHLQNHQTDLGPMIHELPGLKEYVWDLKDVPALPHEPATPSWYDPHPQVQLSEFASWQELAEWAASLFALDTKISPELEQQIEKWKQAGSADDQLLAALDSVQNEVRYLGLEAGIHSHKPADASTVWSRRFGDCKDKASLLCTILNQLGFEACPALVNTETGRTLEQSLPSPLLFNHAIVQVRKAQEVIWLDPTIAHQRGAIQSRFIPDYGRALLARSNITALTVIEASSTGLPKTTVRESFALKGTNEPARLRVVITLEGLDAQDFRASYSLLGRAGVEKAQIGEYARQYPGLETNSSLQIVNATNEGPVTITQDYLIHDVWAQQNFLVWQCRFYPSRLAALLPLPETTRRKNPLAIAYPCSFTHITTVDLPDQIRLRDNSQTIRGPADELRFQRICSAKSMRIEFNYRSLADSVPAAKVTEHTKARAQMQDCLGYMLNWTPAFRSTPQKPSPPPPRIIAWGGPGFGLGMFIVWLVVRKRTEAAESV